MMMQWIWFAVIGVGLLMLGLLGLILHRHLLRRALALNIMGSGIFLIFVALADRTGGAPDPVPHAMVLTGLVVSVSATALLLVLINRLLEQRYTSVLPEDEA